MASKKKSTKITKTEMNTRRIDCDKCPLQIVGSTKGLCKVPKLSSWIGEYALAKNCPLAKLVYAQQVEEESPITF